MKQLYFICHKDHLTSGSHGFLTELYGREFSVEIIVFDSQIHFVEILLKTYPDAVFVLFQTEFLAPWLTARGLRTIVFPMYDGCANAPDSYFKLLDNAYVFNFSRDLHRKCIEAGIVSYPVTYYPEYVKDRERDKVDRLFYWQRRPDGPMPETKITRYFSPYVGGIHIHDRPDKYKFLESIAREPDDFAATSNWLPDRESLIDLVATSKYYLAPRVSEGIGMAFLEAMSLGCIVFANNNSTHNQYIHHGHNGFLIDFESRDEDRIRRQIDEAFRTIATGKPIGDNAREFMRAGTRIWRKQAENIRKMAVVVHDADAGKQHGGFEQLLGRFLAILYYFTNAYFFFLFSMVVVKVGAFAPAREPKWYVKIYNGMAERFRIVVRNGRQKYKGTGRV